MATGSVDVEALFAAHHRELHRFAARRVGPDDAQDVVADVFVVAWRRRDDVPDGAARAWLFAVEPDDGTGAGSRCWRPAARAPSAASGPASPQR